VQRCPGACPPTGRRRRHRRPAPGLCPSSGRSGTARVRATSPTAGSVGPRPLPHGVTLVRSESSPGILAQCRRAAVSRRARSARAAIRLASRTGQARTGSFNGHRRDPHVELPGHRARLRYPPGSTPPPPPSVTRVPRVVSPGGVVFESAPGHRNSRAARPISVRERCGDVRARPRPVRDSPRSRQPARSLSPPSRSGIVPTTIPSGPSRQFLVHPRHNGFLPCGLPLAPSQVATVARGALTVRHHVGVGTQATTVLRPDFGAVGPKSSRRPELAPDAPNDDMSRRRHGDTRSLGSPPTRRRWFPETDGGPGDRPAESGTGASGTLRPSLPLGREGQREATKRGNGSEPESPIPQRGWGAGMKSTRAVMARAIQSWIDWIESTLGPSRGDLGDLWVVLNSRTGCGALASS
jgi:hypothetical protein